MDNANKDPRHEGPEREPQPQGSRDLTANHGQPHIQTQAEECHHRRKISGEEVDHSTRPTPIHLRPSRKTLTLPPHAPDDAFRKGYDNYMSPPNARGNRDFSQSKRQGGWREGTWLNKAFEKGDNTMPMAPSMSWTPPMAKGFPWSHFPPHRPGDRSDQGRKRYVSNVTITFYCFMLLKYHF